MLMMVDMGRSMDGGDISLFVMLDSLNSPRYASSEFNWNFFEHMLCIVNSLIIIKRLANWAIYLTWLLIDRAPRTTC
jgi:hypothetical protein